MENEKVTIGRTYNSKIINNNQSNITKESQINNKLKQYAKLDIQRNLFKSKAENDDVYEDIEKNNYKGTVKAVELGVKGVKKLLTTKVGLVILAIAIVIIIILNLIGGITSVVTSIGSAGSPNIEEEQATKLKEMMVQLDKNCSNNLVSGFNLQGEAETDWKAALSLLLGYYNNDLTEFNETLSVTNLEAIINQASAVYHVDKWLICGLIYTESTWRNLPANQYDAVGYMQNTPDACEEVGYDYSQMSDPYQNIMCGTAYIKHCIDLYPDNLTNALSCYNAGPTRTANWLKNPNYSKDGKTLDYIPYKETREYVIKVPNYAEQYRNRTMHIPEGEVNVSNNVINNNSKLAEIYNLINEVSSDHKTLTRNDFYTVLEKLEFDDNQQALALALYECNLWSTVFGDDYDYQFKITGNYNSNSIDSGNLTGSRKRIIERAKELLGKPYLWGGREYTLNKPADQVHNVDCSGFTGLLMAEVFGATYYNGPATWTQRDNYCYQISEAEALPGDIVFNASCSHTLIYAGKKDGVNYFYHSPQTGDVIKCSQYNKPVTFWRLKGVNYED